MHTVVFVGIGVLLMAYIYVHGIIENLHCYLPEHCDNLVDIMGIDINWRMYQLSDRDNRCAQIMIILICPSKLLLLYEIMKSLEIYTRKYLLCWIIKESN